MQFRFPLVLVLGVCVLTVGVGVATVAEAQSFAGAASDPVESSPEHFRVLIDNGYLRVLDVRHQPGESDDMHRHPTSAYFVFSGDRMRFQLERSAKDGDVKPGTVTLQGPIEAHSVENIGESALHLVMVERKENTLQRSEGEDAVDVSSTLR